MNTSTDNTQEENKSLSMNKKGEEKLILEEGTVGEPKNEVSENVQPSGEQQFEMAGGVACPIDPMERLQCESCQ